MRITRAWPGWLHCSQPPFGRSVPVAEFARMMHVTEQTVSRWLRAGRLPPATVELARVKVLGLLPFKRWEGWRVDEQGQLWSPLDHDYWPDLIEAGWIVRRALDTSQRENNGLRARIEQLHGAFATVMRFSIYGECLPMPGDPPSNSIGALLHELFSADRARAYIALVQEADEHQRTLLRTLKLAGGEEMVLAIPDKPADGKPTARLLIAPVSDAGDGGGFGPKLCARQTS